jgi:gag-polypeptide of LTR copia-type
LDCSNGDYYKPAALSLLNDDKLEKHEKEQDKYEQKQASVCEVIYRTINKSMFIQVKNETDAAAIWKKVISIHANKGSMFKTNLLMQLQNSHYVEGDAMWEHLAKMVEIKERLAEMGCLLSNQLFVSYICTSISLAPSFSV